MGTKGYRNIAKSGVKAASARRRQAVAKAGTRRVPLHGPPAKKPRIEIRSEDRPDGAGPPPSDAGQDPEDGSAAPDPNRK